MTQAAQLTNAFQEIGADIKAILASRGSMAALTTTDKTSLVAAINELKVAVGAASNISDTATNGDTTHTWSADKIYDELQALKNDLLNGAGSAWDTLKEIEDWATTNGTAVSGLVTAVANRVAFDAAQTLTTPQKLQACTNIGVGDPETDFVGIYNTAKA